MVMRAGYRTTLTLVALAVWIAIDERVHVCAQSPHAEDRASSGSAYRIVLPEPGQRYLKSVRRSPTQRARPGVQGSATSTTGLSAERARQALAHVRSSSAVRQTQPAGYRPKHLRVAGTDERFATEGERHIATEPIIDAPIMGEGGLGDSYIELQPGDEEWEPAWEDAETWDDGGVVCDACGGAGCDGGGCTACFLNHPYAALASLGNFSVELGINGFLNPFNRGDSGSFGFLEGVNYGSGVPIFGHAGLGWQAGFKTIQANIAGAGFTEEERQQTFFTLGLFRRNEWGWQGGLAVDWYQDKWYADIDLTQLRGEISWKYPCRHEWGFWFAAGDDSEISRIPASDPIDEAQFEQWDPISLNAFFYRRRLAWIEGGVGRLYAGFSGDKDGLIGSDLLVPLNPCWAIQSKFTYLVPDESRRSNGAENEAWNVGISLVWDLRGSLHAGREVPFAPLLPVADNGSFIVARRATF
jgi:hypothetical protein